HRQFFYLTLISIYLYACQVESDDAQIIYSTLEDSTLFYYRQGWQQIMDEGHYGSSELSYRKALDFDPNFLVGKSVLARLVTSLEEREKLYEEVISQIDRIEGDERLVLDVYMALTKYTNIREKDPANASKTREEALSLAEKNFSQIVRKYPDEIYLKAEYIEVIHANHGAQAALDSLEILASEIQQNNPFLLGYAASLQAELGNYEKALTLATRLEKLIDDPHIPKAFAVYADIYFKMDSLQKAKAYVNRAYGLDHRNLDASRLKDKIHQIMETIEE
ncbi:MAG: hypothetical protein AAFU64_04060, partial [Bacteroidota bacterium]